MTTLFTQEMLDRGFLAGSSFYASLAHSETDIQAYEAAVGEAFASVAAATSAEAIHERLRGPVKHAGFQRLT
jgi:hypothetical protein